MQSPITPGPDNLPQTSEWDTAPPSNVAAHRASLFLWIVAAIELFGCACMSAMFAAISVLPDAQFAEAAAQQGADMAQMETVRKAGPMLAVVFIILGIVPGIAYAILAFFVRKRKSAAVTISLVLAVTQAIVLGIIFLTGLAQGILGANPVALTTNFVMFGTPLALLGAAIYWLYRTQSPAAAAHHLEPRDPWDDDSR